MAAKTSLEVASEVIQTGDVFELGKSLGRNEAFQFMRRAVDAALARQFALMKQAKLWEKAGRKSWEEFCRVDIGMDRKTVDHYIDALQEFGDRYFATAKQLRITTDHYRLLEAHIDDDGKIEIDGEKLAFSKDNAPRIKAYIELQKRATAKIEEEKKAAQRALSEASLKLKKIQEANKKLYQGSTEAQVEMFRASAMINEACSMLEAARNKPGWDEDYDSALRQAVGEYAFTRIAEVCDFKGHIAIAAAQMDATEPLVRHREGKVKTIGTTRQ